MAKMKDYRNQQFGCLLAIEPTDSRGANGSVIWKCLCQNCQSEIFASSKNLIRNPKECSECKTKSELGKVYGNLTVESYINTKKTGSWWLCKCKCGNYTTVSTASLRSNHVKSCGCLQKFKASQSFIDLTGQTFGRWKVISRAGSNANRQATWLCECSCKQHTRREISGVELRRGTTLSCGCLRMSHGEYIIANILQKANIPYETEKKFDTCILPTGNYARFDFWVNNSYLIEFDGIQHFQEDKFFKSPIDNDKYKNQWCQNNNIPLIRIPYTKLSELNLEDLKLETSQYKII